MICNGRMLFINGRNPIPSSKVDCLPLFITFISPSFLSRSHSHPIPYTYSCARYSLLFSLHVLTIYLLYLVTVGSIQSSTPRRKVPNGYWEDVENRRKFFAEFAQSKGFDPLDSHRWNQYYATDVIKHQVRSCCSFPLSYHTLLFL